MVILSWNLTAALQAALAIFSAPRVVFVLLFSSSSESISSNNLSPFEAGKSTGTALSIKVFPPIGSISKPSFAKVLRFL